MEIGSEETDRSDLLSNIDLPKVENKDDEYLSWRDRSKDESVRKSFEIEKNNARMKLLRTRPNYFIGFRVYNPIIHQNIKNFQQKLIKTKPELYPTLINIPTLHITLAVTHLANENDIEKVKKSLQEWGVKNIESLIKKPINLNFKGIGTFNGRVAYVDLERCENYNRICDLAYEIKNLLKTAGFPDTDGGKRYNPHLTILKVGYKQRVNKKDIEMLKKCDEHFGSQLVSHVQLLSMSDPKDETGYYKCLCQIDTSDSVIEGSDHSDCCEPIPEPDLLKDF